MSDAELFFKKLIKDPNIIYVSLFFHLSLTLSYYIIFNFTLITQKKKKINVETGLICLYLNMLLLFLSVMLASYLTLIIVRK
jgi:hypothetical protein